MARPRLSDFDKRLRNTISLNLRRLMNGMTQNELSVKTGIPVSTISGYIARRSTPRPDQVQKLADFFGVKKSLIDPRFSESDTNLDQLSSIDCSSERKFLMDKLAKADDADVAKLAKLWDIIDNEE